MKENPGSSKHENVKKNSRRKRKNYFDISIWMSLAITFMVGVLVGGGISHVHLMNGRFEKVEWRSMVDPVECTLQHYSFDPVDSNAVNELISWHKSAHGKIRKSMHVRSIYFESLFRDTLGKSNTLYLLKVLRKGHQATPKSYLDVHKKLDSISKKVLTNNLKNSMKAEIALMPDFIEKAVAKQQHEQSE